MHTFKISLNKEGGEAIIHHHSDFSGNAIIQYKDESYDRWTEVEIPGRILLAIGEATAWKKVKDDIISHIEGLR